MSVERKIKRKKAKRQWIGFNDGVEEKEKISFSDFWKYIFKRGKK